MLIQPLEGADFGKRQRRSAAQRQPNHRPVRRQTRRRRSRVQRPQLQLWLVLAASSAALAGFVAGASISCPAF